MAMQTNEPLVDVRLRPAAGRHLANVIVAMALVLLMLLSAGPLSAEPGDYGYHHEEYHRRGLVEELQRKTGWLCCDEVGECRATYVRLPERKVYLEGRWCTIDPQVPVRTDLPLPDEFALVCAGRARTDLHCPNIYCIAVPPGT